MGIKEKEHEAYFLKVIEDATWLPLFEKVFSWGKAASRNDVDLESQFPVEEAVHYCASEKTD